MASDLPRRTASTLAVTVSASAWTAAASAAVAGPLDGGWGVFTRSPLIVGGQAGREAQAGPGWVLGGGAVTPYAMTK
jgi:hypothetical protein